MLACESSKKNSGALAKRRLRVRGMPLTRNQV